MIKRIHNDPTGYTEWQTDAGMVYYRGVWKRLLGRIGYHEENTAVFYIIK